MAKNNIEIIYEDQQIIAVNKPAGISVTADRTGKINLIDFLQIQRKEEQKLKNRSSARQGHKRHNDSCKKYGRTKKIFRIF